LTIESESVGLGGDGGKTNDQYAKARKTRKREERRYIDTEMDREWDKN